MIEHWFVGSPPPGFSVTPSIEVEECMIEHWLVGSPPPGFSVTPVVVVEVEIIVGFIF